LQFESVSRTAENQNVGSTKLMKIARSQEEALSRATAALSAELYEVEKDIKATLASIDGYAEADIPDYLRIALANGKTRVADLTVARMSLYDISWYGTKEAPKA